MKELYLNNQWIELNQSEPIQYNFQVNDIGDVESRQATFTNTIEIPRTPENVKLLNGLGLVGDNSRLPYQKIKADLFEFTIPIMSNGWAVISSTDDKYNLNIYTGIVDLFKAIENKTIGTDLDLSETDHDRDLITIHNSFTNNTYRYIVADYNGKTHFVFNKEQYINTDYLVPSISCKFIMDKIQETFGFEFIGSVFTNPKYLNWWMTYPKPVPKYEDEEAINPVEVAIASITNLLIDNSIPDDVYEHDITYDTTDEFQGEWINNQEFRVLNTGTYSLTINGKGEADYQYEDNWTNLKHDVFYIFPLRVYVNGVATDRNIWLRNQEVSVSFSVYANDVVSLKYEETFENKPNWRLYSLKIDTLSLSLSQITSGRIIFGDALLDFSIKDFFKEFLWLFGLTPIPKNDNQILFLTTEERKNAEVVDWSDKYDGRTSEEYIYGNYAQRNFFRHKYNTDNSTYNDGYFRVINQNLEDQKDVIQSKIYTTEKDKVEFLYNDSTYFHSNVYPIWEKEIQEKDDENGNTYTEIKYKDLSNRYYFLRSEFVDQEIKLGSQSLRDYNTFQGFAKENYNDLAFSQVVQNEYLSLNSLVNNSRKHFIQLKNLSPVEIQNLRFDVVYYFEQEQNYYLLNKLPFQTGKKNIAEFIRIIR